MTRTAWKAHERRTAQALGGQRAGATGRDNADIVGNERLTIECKERKALPQWLKDAVHQVLGYAENTDTLPIVVIHELGARGDNDLVVMRRKDFVELLGGKNE